MLHEIYVQSGGDTMQPVWTTDLAEALGVPRREALVIARQLHEDGFVILWGVDSEDRGKVRITGRGIKECERKARPPRKRRRARPRKPAPLTPEQVEAVLLVGEHKGNFTAAAKAAGKSRQAMQKLFNKANKKLGKKIVEKVAKTQRLPTDQRGQVNVPNPATEEDE
jgi:predicted DNA-binding protein (UPF0251 family)